jgi:hypothetical protein
MRSSLASISAFWCDVSGRGKAMKWVRERDLLIAQTLAFVQSVSGKKPAGEVPSEVTVSPEAKTRIDRQLETNVEKAIAAEPARDERILELPRMIALPSVDLRQEIQSRVALFRAHQQRFHKERDEYYISKMAQLRVPKKGVTGPSA